MTNDERQVTRPFRRLSCQLPLAWLFHTSHKTPTELSAGLQPALGETDAALRANECEISGLVTGRFAKNWIAG